MGSKSKIMGFVLEGVNEIYRGGVVCDLFAGSASLAGAIGQQCAVHSNDIQKYSAILSQAYSNSYSYSGIPGAEQILTKAASIVRKNSKAIGSLTEYSAIGSLEEFNSAEDLQKQLVSRTFRREWHLFLKNYSGTWWSAEQCLWIDALREVAETYRVEPCYPAVMSSLMFAMAYTSQGTGHYAQYRDAKTEGSLSDILIYRKRAVAKYFERKYNEVLLWMPKTRPVYGHLTTTLDYRQCLSSLRGGTVYADPPYCFVHYSRFYHALETLVLYDYPKLQAKNGVVVKGRYREDRHQSPFCIKSQVTEAFCQLFKGVAKSKSNLAMSYSNTGMITIEEIEKLATAIFSGKKIEVLFTDHQHMTLGRLKDRHREVQECLLLVS
ncbi:MAG: DNA adenine methylase [Gammaproteobacteria bacterium]|nr:DNA adenine methylase [Gammaproteobacteria bacterium]